METIGDKLNLSPQEAPEGQPKPSRRGNSRSVVFERIGRLALGMYARRRQRTEKIYQKRKQKYIESKIRRQEAAKAKEIRRQERERARAIIRQQKELQAQKIRDKLKFLTKDGS